MRHSPSSTRIIAAPLAALIIVIALCLVSTVRNRSDAPPGILTPQSGATPTAAPAMTAVAAATDAPVPTATAAPATAPTATVAGVLGATDAPMPSATPTPTVTLAPAAALAEPYYGMHFVPTSELGTVRELGAEVVLMSFPHDGTPDDWLAYLDAAWAEQIRVIAWLWPEGWRWDGATWQIDEQAELFVRTVSTHPALLAVYALHEPYWNGCWGCGYTTAEQQALYSAIKAIADVPVHSAVDSMSAWTAYGEETAFAEGICDYCETWYHPFLEDGTYQRDEFISHVEADLAVARERAPKSKIIWSLQSFAQEGTYRMPSAEEMKDVASIVTSSGVDGALWYPWNFGELYSDFLSNHPELYDTIKQVYEEDVLPSRSGRGGADVTD